MASLSDGILLIRNVLVLTFYMQVINQRCEQLHGVRKIFFSSSLFVEENRFLIRLSVFPKTSFFSVGSVDMKGFHRS